MKLFLPITGLKQLFTILFFLILPLIIFAQDTNLAKKKNDSIPSDSLRVLHTDSAQKDSTVNIRFQKKIIRKDSLGKQLLINDSAKALTTRANTSDTLTDTSKRDSTQIVVQKPPAKKSLLKKNPVYLMPGTPRNAPDSDLVFYILIFLLFFLGLVKTSFPKYVNSIFSLSFQAQFRQTQTKEQMAQNFFPAFMLNVLFVLCGGLFITLFAENNNWTTIQFWQLFVYSTAILLIIYLVKYIVISFTGWVFNTKDAATEYRFVIFLINKLFGIILLPLLFLIAYGDNKIQNISITIVICMAVFSLAIRYLVSLARIRKNLSITAFHIFIYLCAVEIMPLLVIYKILFLQTSNR